MERDRKGRRERRMERDREENGEMKREQMERAS